MDYLVFHTKRKNLKQSEGPGRDSLDQTHNPGKLLYNS